MVDVIEIPPPAVDQLGHLLIIWVPKSGMADPLKPKVAELKAGKRITYSLTPDGWQPTGDQEITKDERLTLEQDLESFGKKTKGLSLKYVDSDDPNSAAVLLEEGLEGYFFERRKELNRADIAAGQKVRPWGVVLGEQMEDTPSNTGKFTISQKTSLTAVVPSRGVLVVA